MMTILPRYRSIYLDTSFVMSIEEPWREPYVVALLRERLIPSGKIMWSKVLLDELETIRTGSIIIKKNKSEDSIAAYFWEKDFQDFFITEPDANDELMAQNFIEAGLIPASEKLDALHLAIATSENAGALATWDEKHLANPRVIAGYRKYCRAKNIVPVEIILPAKL